jgi:hypothetical protein
MYAPTDVTQYPLGMGTVDPAFWTDYAAYAAAYSAYTAQLGSTAAEVFPPVPPDPNDPKYTHPATGGDWGNFVADYNTYMNTIYNQYVADYKIAYNQYQKRRFDTMQSMIPRAQREFDLVVNKIATLINDTFSPVDAATGLLDVANAPRDQRDTPTGLEIFVRKYPPYSDRYDPATGVVNPENPNDIYSLYAMGNLIINPLLSNSDGYAKLPLSRTGDVDDNNLVNDIMEIWKSNEEGKAIFFEYMDKDGYWIREWVSVDKAYQIFVSHTGTDTAEAQTYVDAQTAVVVNLDNKRQAISGVSLDEELANMLTFQHAYNASARVVNEVDSMLDRIINRVGRVGL